MTGSAVAALSAVAGLAVRKRVPGRGWADLTPGEQMALLRDRP